MAKEKKITTLSGDAKENLKQVKENFKDGNILFVIFILSIVILAEKMRKDLNPQYKAVKEQMYKKWLDSCESLFDDIDDDMNFIDALKLLALGKHF